MGTLQQLESWWLCITLHFTSWCSTSMLWMLFLSALLSLILICAAYTRSCPPLFNTLPPGPSALPLLGNLHQLLKPLPHQTLADLAKQHSPLMRLYMGSRLALFISNSTMAKAFFQAHDKDFASRPRLAFCNRLLYGQHSGVAFSVYGSQWRKMRRICMLELFTTKRIQSFQKVLETELEVVVKELRLLCAQNKGAVEVNVAHLAHLIVSNIMGRLVLSKRMCDTIVNGDSLLDMFKKTNDAIVPAVGDFIPYLGCLLDLKSTRNMDNVHKDIDTFWKAILEERSEHRAAHSNSFPADFLDVLLSNEEVIELGDDNIKATLMDILGAGSETSAITIEWVMAELLQNPHCLKKLQAELNTACPKEAASVLPFASPSSASSEASFQLPWQNILTSNALPSMFLSCAEPPSVWPSPFTASSHIADTHYVKAVVKETLRLHPPVPLLIPRESTGRTCTAEGYIFPANTILFLNAWAIGRDGEAWDESEVFRPERFMGGIKKEGDCDGSADFHNNYQMLPFGMGRRRCPGMGLALCIMELTVATLVWAFHWEIPYGYVLEMGEKSGNAGTHKAKPLRAILTPR